MLVSAVLGPQALREDPVDLVQQGAGHPFALGAHSQGAHCTQAPADVALALPVFLNGSVGALTNACPPAGAGAGHDGAEVAESALVQVTAQPVWVDTRTCQRRLSFLLRVSNRY